MKINLNFGFLFLIFCFTVAAIVLLNLVVVSFEYLGLLGSLAAAGALLGHIMLAYDILSAEYENLKNFWRFLIYLWPKYGCSDLSRYLLAGPLTP